MFLALMTWGDRHEAGPAGPPVVARHAGCGGDLRISFTCSCGHADVEPHAVELVAGPGAVPVVRA